MKCSIIHNLQKLFQHHFKSSVASKANSIYSRPFSAQTVQLHRDRFYELIPVELRRRLLNPSRNIHGFVKTHCMSKYWTQPLVKKLTFANQGVGVPTLLEGSNIYVISHPLPSEGCNPRGRHLVPPVPSIFFRIPAVKKTLIEAYRFLLLWQKSFFFGKWASWKFGWNVNPWMSPSIFNSILNHFFC